MVRLIVTLVVAIAAVAISGGACTLLDDDPPDDSCRDDSDCFRAQGETCNPTTKRCVINASMDAGVDAP